MDSKSDLQHSVESRHVNTLAVVQLSDDGASPVNSCLHTNTRKLRAERSPSVPAEQMQNTPEAAQGSGGVLPQSHVELRRSRHGPVPLAIVSGSWRETPQVWPEDGRTGLTLDRSSFFWFCCSNKFLPPPVWSEQRVPPSELQPDRQTRSAPQGGFYRTKNDLDWIKKSSEPNHLNLSCSKDDTYPEPGPWPGG